MKRDEGFAGADVHELQAFALSLGLRFARDLRVAEGRRRACIHECGHALMYIALGVHGWYIELDGDRGPEIFNPPEALECEAVVLMGLAGPLAEEKLCGPKGVFRGAVDDIWQVREAARTLGAEATDLLPLVVQARDIVAKHGASIVAMAELLQRQGRLSEEDVSAKGAQRPLDLVKRGGR